MKPSYHSTYSAFGFTSFPLGQVLLNTHTMNDSINDNADDIHSIKIANSIGINKSMNIHTANAPKFTDTTNMMAVMTMVTNIIKITNITKMTKITKIGVGFSVGIAIGLSSQYVHAQSFEQKAHTQKHTQNNHHLQKSWSLSSNVSTLSAKLASFRADPIDRPIKIIKPKENLSATTTNTNSYSYSSLRFKQTPSINPTSVKSESTSAQVVASKPANTLIINENSNNKFGITNFFNRHLKPLTQRHRQTPSVSVSSQINIVSSTLDKPLQNSLNQNINSNRAKLNADLSDKEQQIRLQNNRDVLAQYYQPSNELKHHSTNQLNNRNKLHNHKLTLKALSKSLSTTVGNFTQANRQTRYKQALHNKPINRLINQSTDQSTNQQTNKPNQQTAAQSIKKQFGKNDDFANYNWIDKTPRCSGRWVYPTPPNLTQSFTQRTKAQSPNTQQNLLLSQADYGYYADKNYAELRGNVIVQNHNKKGAQTVQADRIRVDVNSKDIYAEGNVLYADGNSSKAKPANLTHQAKHLQPQQNEGRIKDGNNGLITVADRLTFNPDSRTATAQAVAFANVPLQAHGYAGKLSKTDDNQYALDDVMLTTCPPDDVQWQINAKNIAMNSDTGRGSLRGGTLKIKEVPVLYLPYFNFPIDSRRTSGFLVPHLSTSDGFALDIPYYLNLAPNYDATITPKIYNNRNPLITNELRYLTDKYGRGRIVNSFLSKDKQYHNKNRSSVFYTHEWQSKKTPELTANLEYNYVSDSDYFADFDSLGTRNNTLNLSRQANVNYYNDRLNAQLKFETFQSLDAFDIYGNPITDKDKPYSRYPQLLVNYNAPIFKDWQLAVVHDSAYFKQNINDNSAPEKSGLRVYNKVKTSIPLQKSWGYITPEASIQHIFSQYDKDSLEALSIPANDGTSSALVPQIGVDAGLHFFQAGPPPWWANQQAGGYQLLNPRLKYTYSPYQTQNDIPNFDTRIATVTYDQLFADSWFLGHDRIQDLHAITPGVNYRYIDATGLTRLDASIGSQFYLDSGRVTLDDNVIDIQHPAINANNRLFDDTYSGIVTTLSSQPYKNWWVDVNGALSSNNNLSYLTTQVRYQPNPYSLFNVGFVKRKLDKNTNQLPLTATTMAATFPLNKNWRLLAQGQYNWQTRKLFDGLMGLDYEDCCMGFSLYSRRYYNELNPNAPPKTSFMAELRLNGLGQSTGNLARTMSKKVLGFDKVDQQWKR